MRLGVSTRHAFEHVRVVETAEPPRQRPRHSNELVGLLGDRVAQSVQLRARRHPQSTGRERLARLKMKVEAGAPLVRFAADATTRASMMEPASRVRLVRRFVLREPDVAIDAKHRSLGIAADLGSEMREPSVELLDELTHRLAHFLLIYRAVGLEPLFVVVPRELTKEAQGRWGEWHRLFLLTIQLLTPPACRVRKTAAARYRARGGRRSPGRDGGSRYRRRTATGRRWSSPTGRTPCRPPETAAAEWSATACRSRRSPRPIGEGCPPWSSAS